MKGIIFKEFLNMVEDNYNYELVDQIIQSSGLEHDGVYTSVGTYPHAEMARLVANFSLSTGIPVKKALEQFGEYAFKVFAAAYAKMLEGHANAFSFLASVENTIHVEVLKLYPEAELPALQVAEMDKGKMILIYKSSRKMSDFARGLMKGCLKHFNEKATIKQINIEEDRSEVKFIIIQK